MTTARQWSAGRMGAAAAGVVCLWVAGAPAQHDTTPSGIAPADVLAALDSDSYAARESATQALANDLSVTDEEIASLMARRDLSAEQSWRLVEALRTRFLATPRGAMGISYDRETNPPRISQVWPEFPAAKAGLLKPGDEILAIEGQPLEPGRYEVMQRETFSRDPGDILRVRIRRTESVEGDQPGDESGRMVTRVLDLEVKLGSTAGFSNPGGLPLDYSGALETRLARMGVTMPETQSVRSPVDDAAWNRGVSPGPGPINRWHRVMAGPLESNLEGPGRFARVAAAQQNARLVRQLDALRQGGNAANLQNALNVRVQNEDLGGAARVERVQVPVELKQQNAERLLRVRAQMAEAQRRRMVLQMELEGLAKPGTREGVDPVSEANRLASRIGALEAQIAEQTRLLHGSAGEDPNVRRLAEERIGELRVRVAELRLRLLDAMDGHPDREAEASLDGE